MPNSCFVISPIGKPNTDVRVRADKILKHVIKPVCKERGLEAVRADEINDPGLISRRIIKEILVSDLVIADLTGRNPNVFYELAIRHFTGRPIVQLIELNDVLPFDVFDFKTIQVDHKDIDSIEDAKEKLGLYIDAVLAAGRTETPITMELAAQGISLPTKQAKKSLEQELLALTNKVVHELEQSRKERTQLIENIVGHREAAYSKEDESMSGDERTVNGLWDGNHGKVIIKQNDDFVVGEYEYDSHGWVGEIMGKVIEDIVVFEWSWKDGSMEGIGFWRIHGTEMIGAWLYRSECDLTLNDLLIDPSLIDSISNPSDREWHLSKVS